TMVQALAEKDGFVSLVVGVDPTDITQQVMLHRTEANSNWRELKRYARGQGSFIPLAFTADNKKVYGISDTNTSTQSISVFDLDTLEETTLANHPKVDLEPIFSVENGKATEIIGANFEHDA